MPAKEREKTRQDWRAAKKKAVEEAAGEVGVEFSRLYLFGSRARGQADAESDWDILVVVRGGLERGRQRELFVRISQRLAEKRSPADIIIRSEAQFEKARRRVFSIEKIAAREGILLGTRKPTGKGKGIEKRI